jgi:putative ABC transport system permease protein
LERKPLQAFLSLLGIAIAAALLVAGLYIKDALNYLVEVQFRLVQRQDVTITFNEPRPARTRYEVARLPGVIRSEFFRVVAARLRFRHRTYRTALTGIEPTGEFRRLIGKELYAVHLPAEGVVLTAKLAEILGVRPGDTLTVEVLEGSRPVRQVAVVGTVDELLGLQAYLDIRALNRLLREGGTISGAFLAVDARRAGDLYAQIKRLPAIAGFSTREATVRSFQKTTAQILLAFTSVLVIFASIITFSVVYNSSRIALSERSRELASLRIIGFTRREVAFILLGEQAILTLLAIPVGWGLGWGLAALMSLGFNAELYRLPLVISRGTYAGTVVIVLAAAVISGLIIRRQLNRLDLIGVLKTRE